MFCWWYFLFFASDVPPSQKLPPHGYPLEHPFNKVCTIWISFWVKINIIPFRCNYFFNAQCYLSIFSHQEVKCKLFYLYIMHNVLKKPRIITTLVETMIFDSVKKGTGIWHSYIILISLNPHHCPVLFASSWNVVSPVVRALDSTGLSSLFPSETVLVNTPSWNIWTELSSIFLISSRMATDIF